MAHPIHQETFYWIGSEIKNDMLVVHLNSIQASPPTIILAKDMYRVHHVARLLWDCNFHATYYHEGHTQDQLVEAIDSFFSQQTPILVLSLQTDSIQYFVGSAQWVLVLDFPGSIDHYQDWKSLVNMQDRYDHITSFISDPDLHLLTELQSYLTTKYETVPSWLTDKLSHVSISAVSSPDSHVCQAPILPSPNVIRCADQPMVWPQPNTLPLSFNPPESVCRPDLEIDADNLGRSYPQVDSPPVFSPQSSNCSSNGDNIPTQSHDEYLDTQAEAWILDGDISNYDHDDNHSQPSLGDENTHCCDSGYHSGSASLKNCDLGSSENHDQDSWLTLDNSQCHPPVSQENPPTEAGPPETMAEEQQLAFPASQPAESQVVVAKELEIQATQVTPANKQMQLHSIAQSKGELQEVHGPSCSPTQANQDELAAVTDIPTLWGCSFHDQSSGDVSPSGQSPEEVADPQAK